MGMYKVFDRGVSKKLFSPNKEENVEARLLQVILVKKLCKHIEGIYNNSWHLVLLLFVIITVLQISMAN